MTKPRKVCGDCGHHRSAHTYTPESNGRWLGPCTVPNCLCRRFRQLAPGERAPYLSKRKKGAK